MTVIAIAPLVRCVARRLSLVLLFAGTGGTVSAAEHWLVGRSEHFEMYSSCSEAESKRMLTALEQFRANFLALFPLAGASEPRATVALFASDSAFRPYKPLHEGKPKPVAGYFLQDPDEVTIALTSDVPDVDADPRQIIYHEYVHLLLHARDARYPLWLEEGLAEALSTFEIDNGKVMLGEPKKEHVALLQHSGLMPLSRLFAVTHESPEYNEDSRMSLFYAEAWAFTHYLLFGDDKANAGKLAKLATLLAQGETAENSFRQVFGTDFSTQEIALRSYVTSGGYYKRGKPAVANNVQVGFRPATDAERDCALLNLRWRIHHNDDAAGRALALLEKNAGLARAHELLAAIAMHAGDTATAQEHWKAAALKSDNPWVYVQLLHQALDVYAGASMLDVRLSTEQLGDIRSWAHRALSLSPDNGEAIELALVAEAIAAQMDVRVVNAVQPRVRSMREPARAYLALGIIHWRGNDLDGARKIADIVALQPRADMNTRATTTALRYRLPARENGAAGTADAVLSAATADKSGISLQSGRLGAAATYLDQVLVERGTTAPALKLERVLVRANRGSAPDAWQHADQMREKAAGGDPNAMFDLALAHACGTGVEFSPALARDWLQKAVDHGHALAKAGMSPGQLDLDLLARYLRQQRPASTDGALPPLDKELATQIGEAAKAADRHPPVVIYQAGGRFPEAMRRTGKGGEVLLRFVIRVDGHPGDVRAAQFTDVAFATAAEQCLRGWRFLPTIRDGKPVSTLVELTMTYEAANSSGA